MKKLVDQSKIVISYKNTINGAENLYAIEWIAEAGFASAKAISGCYAAIDAMLQAVTELGAGDWKFLNMIGVGNTLLAWMGGKKQCITSLAEDLLRNLGFLK